MDKQNVISISFSISLFVSLILYILALRNPLISVFDYTWTEGYFWRTIDYFSEFGGFVSYTLIALSLVIVFFSLLYFIPNRNAPRTYFMTIILLTIVASMSLLAIFEINNIVEDYNRNRFFDDMDKSTGYTFLLIATTINFINIIGMLFHPLFLSKE